MDMIITPEEHLAEKPMMMEKRTYTDQAQVEARLQVIDHQQVLNFKTAPQEKEWRAVAQAHSPLPAKNNTKKGPPQGQHRK